MIGVPPRPIEILEISACKTSSLWYNYFWVNLRLNRGFALFLFAPHFPRPGLCPCREVDPRHLWSRSSRVLVGARLLRKRANLSSRAQRGICFFLLCDLRAPASVFSVLSLCPFFACELLTDDRRLSTVNFLSGSNHEKQKTKRRTCLETIGRPPRAAPAPVGHRPYGLFASPAAQPPGRKTPPPVFDSGAGARSEEHTSELQSRLHLVCRLLLEKKKQKYIYIPPIKKQKKSQKIK